MLAFAGFALRSILYAMGLCVSHKATFSILGEIRKQIFAKLPRMPLGIIIDTSSGKLKQIIVDEVECIVDWIYVVSTIVVAILYCIYLTK